LLLKIIKTVFYITPVSPQLKLLTTKTDVVPLHHSWYYYHMESKAMLKGELAVPCNLQSATAGLNSLFRH